MKINPRRKILIIYLLCCFNLMSFAQQVTFNVSNVTVKAAVIQFKKATGYSFVFGSSKVDTKKRISVIANNQPLKNVVAQILVGQNLDYAIDGKFIIVKERQPSKQKSIVTPQKNTSKIKVSGKVADEKGEPIIGATIMQKGNTNGTVTDINGNFELFVDPGSELKVSYIGFLPEEVKVTDTASPLSIRLKGNVKNLDEIVVTALGIKREEKSLGYAVQKISGDKLSTVKSVNLGTSLTGKIAGMNIENSTEFNSSPTILIRGESPIIVVDGVPYSNMHLSDINADDVESIDVLKGATASALYGARGGAGAIMVTTKRGNKEGLNISVNSGTMFNSGFLAIPEAQHSYSSGTGGKYDSKDYVWGDKLDIGRTAVQYNPYTYKWEKEPLVSKGKNNFRNFLVQGLVNNSNISISWKGKNGGFRTSLNYVFDKGQYPNEYLRKFIYGLTGYAKYGKLSFEGGALWNKRFYSNDRGGGYGGGGYVYDLIVWTGPNYDVRDYRNYWVKGNEGSKQNWLYSGYYDNPYFLAHECTSSNDYDQLNTYLNIKYDIFPWLNISNRTGVDFYASRTQTKNPIGTIGAGNKNGSFSISKSTGFSINSDFLLSADGKAGDFEFSGFVGGTIYYFYDDGLSASTQNGLTVPGYYSLNASIDPISASSSYTSKMLNSLSARFLVSWKDVVFLDLTGRNDWSSTLPSSTRSYFYPSVSTSVIMSDLIHLPKIISFWKLRGSWTYTKQDLGIFDTEQAYSVSTNVWNKLNSASYPTSLRSSTLKPITSRSYEFGTTVNILNNKLRFDVAYYTKLKYNLTRSATISGASGFTNTLINYGEQQLRKGVEVTLDAEIIKKSNWKWTANVNWALDRYYYHKVDPVYSTQNQWVKKGKRWDWMADYDWERDPKGNLILYNGLPKKSQYLSFVGDEYPDWIWGITTNLSYRNWALNVSLDGRVGGTAYNQTEQAMWNSGSHPKSDNKYRYDEVVNGKITYVAKGVKIVSGSVEYDTKGNIIKDTRVFAPNDVAVSYQNFIQAYEPWSGSAAFQNYRSLTFLKLREIALSYTFPQTVCKWMHLENATVSLIGQNVLLWAKSFKYADPDLASDNLSSPSQRFIGFNFKINF